MNWRDFWDLPLRGARVIIDWCRTGRGKAIGSAIAWWRHRWIPWGTTWWGTLPAVIYKIRERNSCNAIIQVKLLIDVGHDSVLEWSVECILLHLSFVILSFWSRNSRNFRNQLWNGRTDTPCITPFEFWIHIIWKTCLLCKLLDLLYII